MQVNSVWIGPSKKGEALYFSLLSSDRTKSYIVQGEVSKGKLILTHNCKGFRFKGKCRHLTIAKEVFQLWMGRSFVDEEVIYIRKEVTLSPQWRQLPRDAFLSVFNEIEEGLVGHELSTA